MEDEFETERKLDEKQTKHSQKLLNDKLISNISSFFKVLGDETRVKILYALSQNEMCVSDISAMLDMSQSAISHQLKQLKLVGQVKTRREGKSIYYSIDDDHVVDIINKTLSHVEHKIKDGQLL